MPSYWCKREGSDYEHNDPIIDAVGMEPNESDIELVSQEMKDRAGIRYYLGRSMVDLWYSWPILILRLVILIGLVLDAIRMLLPTLKHTSCFHLVDGITL